MLWVPGPTTNPVCHLELGKRTEITHETGLCSANGDLKFKLHAFIFKAKSAPVSCSVTALSSQLDRARRVHRLPLSFSPDKHTYWLWIVSTLLHAWDYSCWRLETASLSMQEKVLAPCIIQQGDSGIGIKKPSRDHLENYKHLTTNLANEDIWRWLFSV